MQSWASLPANLCALPNRWKKYGAWWLGALLKTLVLFVCLFSWFFDSVFAKVMLSQNILCLTTQISSSVLWYQCIYLWCILNTSLLPQQKLLCILDFKCFSDVKLLIKQPWEQLLWLKHSILWRKISIISTSGDLRPYVQQFWNPPSNPSAPS